MASPSAADLPRPLLAVSASVERSVFSLAASRKVTTARAWSSVRHLATCVCVCVLPAHMAACAAAGVSANDTTLLRSVQHTCAVHTPRARSCKHAAGTEQTTPTARTSAPAGCVSLRLPTSSASSALLAAEGSSSSVWPSAAVDSGAMCLRVRACVRACVRAQRGWRVCVCECDSLHGVALLLEVVSPAASLARMQAMASLSRPSAHARMPCTHRMSVLVGSTLSSSSISRQWGQLARLSTRRSLKRPALEGRVTDSVTDSVTEWLVSVTVRWRQLMWV
jgi:hypothetical protein